MLEVWKYHHPYNIKKRGTMSHSSSSSSSSSLFSLPFHTTAHSPDMSHRLEKVKRIIDGIGCNVFLVSYRVNKQLSVCEYCEVTIVTCRFSMLPSPSHLSALFPPWTVVVCVCVMREQRLSIYCCLLNHAGLWKQQRLCHREGPEAWCWGRMCI